MVGTYILSVPCSSSDHLTGHRSYVIHITDVINELKRVEFFFPAASVLTYYSLKLGYYVYCGLLPDYFPQPFIELSENDEDKLDLRIRTENIEVPIPPPQTHPASELGHVLPTPAKSVSQPKITPPPQSLIISTENSVEISTIAKKRKRRYHNNGRKNERTIREAVEKTEGWRALCLEQNMPSNAAAVKVGLPKKTLDEYYSLIMHGLSGGFDFVLNVDKKMGILRDFVKNTRKKEREVVVVESDVEKPVVKDQAQNVKNNVGEKDEDWMPDLYFEVPSTGSIYDY